MLAPLTDHYTLPSPPLLTTTITTSSLPLPPVEQLAPQTCQKSMQWEGHQDQSYTATDTRNKMHYSVATLVLRPSKEASKFQTCDFSLRLSWSFPLYSQTFPLYSQSFPLYSQTFPLYILTFHLFSQTFPLYILTFHLYSQTFPLYILTFHLYNPTFPLYSQAFPLYNPTFPLYS